MIFKKTFAVAFILSIAAMLTSCGKNTDTATSGGASLGTESSDVSLRLWGAEDDAELLKMISDNFIKAHQGEANITINVEYHAESDCRDSILNDVLNAPDVFTFADDQLASLAAGGVLKPISYNVSDISARNSESSVSAASLNGTLFAYPLTADNGYFLYYNKEYLNDNDLQSIESILTVAEANEKKITMDISSGWYFYALFGNTGLSVGLNDDGITNFCDWNRADSEIKGIDVCNAIIDFTTNPGFMNGGDGALVDGANDDTVIAGVSGVWLANSLKEAWGNNLGAVKLPTYKINGKPVQMSSYAGYKMIGVNSYSTNKEWAEKLADFITNEENQTLRFTMREQGPSNKNAAASPDVLASPAIQALIAQSEFSSLQRVGSSYWGPVGNLGGILAGGNPDGKDLQELLDSTVAGITGNN